MPNQYVRISKDRGKWTQEDLTQAIEAILNRNMSVRQASFEYGVPRKTLERRFKTQNFTKGPMGPSSVFGNDHEKRLVKHILKMQEKCFPLTTKDLRTIAFYFAEQLGLKHSFNKEKEQAGYVWLQSFLKRNPEIKIRKAEGVSLARCEALNRDEVNAYYDILFSLLEEFELFEKPSHIFNMDESGLQLNNRPGHVLAKKGSKVVSTVTSTEKGETITVIGCCNAEGTFLPPACIMKGKNKKQEWKDGMPPGSELYMSPKSAYINATIFFEWLKNHFFPRKPAGKVLLCLDGHTSHCNSVEMLEFAAANDIILFTLPSHTTHYLQSLDRSVFKSLKSFYYEACRMWLKQNPGRRITRLQFGELLSTAWSQSATYENAVAGFRATGIYPFNRYAVPEHAFAASNMQNEESQLHQPSSATVTRRTSSPSVLQMGLDEPSTSGIQSFQNSRRIQSPSRDDSTPSLPDVENDPPEMQTVRNICTPPRREVQSIEPGPSQILTIKNNRNSILSPSQNNNNQSVKSAIQQTLATKENEKETPSKFLNEISPIPVKTYQVRKRAKQVATILTSETHINYRKECEERKNEKQARSESNTMKREIKEEKTIGKKASNEKKLKKDRQGKEKEDKPLQKKSKQKKNKRQKLNKNQDSTDTEDDDEPILLESGDSSPVRSLIDDCVGCGDNYYTTELTEDWIQCVICKRWAHENCTEYDDKCHPCGNRIKIDARKGKGEGKKTKRAN